MTSTSMFVSHTIKKDISILQRLKTKSAFDVNDFYETRSYYKTINLCTIVQLRLITYVLSLSKKFFGFLSFTEQMPKEFKKASNLSVTCITCHFSQGLYQQM